MKARARAPKRVAAPTPGRRTGRRGVAPAPILDPIITMNAGGIIQSASDSVEQVFGWTPTELFGQNVKMLIPEPRRSELDRYLDRYRHADKVKTLQRTGRFNAVRKDGKVIRIEMSISRADLPVHEPPFFIGIVRDVTNQIEVGSDDTTERLRLQSLITEQTRALATANLRLQLADRLASLGTLAAGLGHDMNSVLLPVRAHLNAIEHAGIPPKSAGHMTAVRRSIAYLQQLSDGLHFLALDPDGSGAAADSEGPTDLASWWGQVGDLLKKAVPKHVSVQVSLPAKLRPINIAPHWLTQAMLNLIVNAGEAIPPTRWKGLVRIWAHTSDDDRSVLIGVTDNGRGMSHGIQRRALDLFFTTKPRSLGTGLGLPLARKVAIRAGGDIELKSQPGHGTTVQLRIPVAARGRSRLAGRRADRLCATISVRDHRVAALVAHVLSGAGVEIKSDTGNGPTGCDLWITEPRAPALRAARAWAKRRKGGAIVLVGMPKPAAREAWATLGAQFVESPKDFEVMRHVLNQVTTEAAHQAVPRKRSKR